MRITVEMLKEHGACTGQVKLFQQFLKDRKYILTTERNIQLAYKYGLDVVCANNRGLIKLDGCYKTKGSEYWYQNGEYHRLDGPAIKNPNGKHWYQNGKRHRLDGPAIEWANGTKFWFQNGKLHRLDGPAIERGDDTKIWYIDGKELTEDEFNNTKE